MKMILLIIAIASLHKFHGRIAQTVQFTPKHIGQIPNPKYEQQ